MIERLKRNIIMKQAIKYFITWQQKKNNGVENQNPKGPYYIHEKLLNGSYKLKELNGKIVKVPVNGELIKKYNDRYDFEPMVVID